MNSYSSVTSGDIELGGDDSELKIQYFQYMDTVDLKNLKGRNANKSNKIISKKINIIYALMKFI